MDSQIISLQGSGADTFANFTTQKFGALAIRKAYDIGWKPLQFVDSVSSSIGSVLRPAGLDKSIGVITGSAVKHPVFQSSGEADKDIEDYLAFMKRWYPDGDPGDSNIVWTYINAELATLILKRCGDNLTRENLMKQTTSLRDVELPMLMRGVKITITPEDYTPLRELQLMRFDGKNWVAFGEVISASETRPR